MAITSLKSRLTKLQSRTRTGSVKRTRASSDVKILKDSKEKKLLIDKSIELESTIIIIKQLNIPNKLNAESLFKLINEIINLQFTRVFKNTESKTNRLIKMYPKIIFLDMIYSVLPGGNETIIDNLIEQLIDLKKIKCFDMNFENFNFRIIIPYDEFIKIINGSSLSSVERVNFLNLIEKYCNLVQINETLINEFKLNVPKLINVGLICLSTKSIGNYNLTLPHLGSLLRIIFRLIKFVEKNCLVYRDKQILDQLLREKYQSKINFYKGLNLECVLSFMIGKGLLEVFNSPVGLIYRLTGKGL